MLKKFISNDFTFRASLVDLTSLIQTLKESRQLSPLATEALAQALTGTLLMASHLKPHQGVGTLIQGSGALGRVYAEAYHTGEMRAYCSHPEIQGPSLNEVIGEGVMTVTRHQPYQKSPFLGTVPLVGTSMAEFFEHYLLQSQQIRSIMSLLVEWNNDRTVLKKVSGYLIEIMPGVDDDLFQQLKQQNSKDHQQMVFTGFPITEIPYPYALRYECPCSLERVLNAMTLFPEEDLDAMIGERGETVVCQMCGEIYQVSAADLEQVKYRRKKNLAN